MLARCKRGTAASATSAARGTMGKHYLRGVYHAPQGRNGACTVLSSPRLKALVQQHFAASSQPATVAGVGSVAHTQHSIPNAYTVGACSGHGQVVGTGNALCGGLTKGYGYVPAYTATMHGGSLVYCLQCRVWALALGHKLYTPKPAAPVLTATQAAAKLANPQLKQASSQRPFSGTHTNGNAMVGGKYTAH